MAGESTADVFPPGPYRFHAGITRGDPVPFFRACDATGAIRAERRHWLSSDPGRYASVGAGGLELVEEFARLCRDWGVGDAGDLEALGGDLEPDFLLLAPGPDGIFRLRAGVVCFPSGWDLGEKMGEPMEAIHDPVPGLNATLGQAIHRILSGLKPGVGSFRSNWGLAATDALNMHPSLGFPAPEEPVRLDRLWLRIEHQVLTGLPSGRGILFGIRLALHRLDDLARDAAATEGLARALETMPAAVASYKRLRAVQAPLASALRAVRF